MAKRNRVTLEIGPKGKKVVAVAPDWPGLERGAKNMEDAIERLRSYVPRYAQIAKLAAMDAEFSTIKNFEVVEQYPGVGGTDFWGISFTFSSIDKQGMSDDELERELALMQACWRFFDDVMLTGKALKAYRDAYCHGIRDYHSQGKWAGNKAKWPLRFLIRHTAFHTLDHAWEMEDKNLTAKKA